MVIQHGIKTINGLGGPIIPSPKMDSLKPMMDHNTCNKEERVRSSNFSNATTSGSLMRSIPKWHLNLAQKQPQKCVSQTPEKN